MPVQLKWDDEPCTIIHGVFSGYWTWDDVTDATQRVKAMCTDHPYRVDVLADMLNLTYRPPRPSQAMLRFVEQMPVSANLEMVVFIVNPFTYGLLYPAITSYPLSMPYQFAPELEAGRTIITKARKGEALPAYFS